MAYLKGVEASAQVTESYPDKHAKCSRVSTETFCIANIPKSLYNMYVSQTCKANNTCQRS